MELEMDKIKCKIPPLMKESFDILIDSLKYYEFAHDKFLGNYEFSEKIYRILNHIQDNYEIKTDSQQIPITKYYLPSVSFSTYLLMIEAVKYYRISSIEFTYDVETLTDFFTLIDFMSSNTKFFIEEKELKEQKKKRKNKKVRM